MLQIIKRRLYDKVAAVSKFLHEGPLSVLVDIPRDATKASQTPDVTANCFARNFWRLPCARASCASIRVYNLSDRVHRKPVAAILCSEPNTT
jgi:hypothetical protein